MHSFKFLLFIFNFIAISQGFNIDEKFPIIFENHFDNKESLFGYQVLLLKDDRVPSSMGGWIFISAPKGNSSHPNHKYIHEPGTIFKCEIGKTPITKNRCHHVVIDPTAEYDGGNRMMRHKDEKDGGWLGGAMFVSDSFNHSRFVACASRWINQKYGKSLMNGMCYWVPKKDLMVDASSPDWLNLPPKFSYRLSPLLNISRRLLRIPDPQLPQRQWKRHNYWVYGQAGFSVHIPSSNEMILGAPGIYDWTGSVIQYRDSGGHFTIHRRHNTHPKSEAFSESIVANVTHDSGVEFASYLGYAVTSGRYITSEKSLKTQYAAGAPRGSSLSGKVLIFTFSDGNSKNLGSINEIAEPILGENSGSSHYGSYFGSVLCTVNVNADDYDDLIVGAPLFSKPKKPSRDKEEPSSEKEVISWTGDEGCIFLYKSDGKKFDENPQQICGEKAPFARFGSSIAAIGDINKDGFTDVAVGAPYQGNGLGKVFIYHGGAKLKLTQTIEPPEHFQIIKNFGISISAGVDIDNNHYPDIAIGASGSNTAILYRTIPIVTFFSNLSSSVPIIKSMTKRFEVKHCIWYEGKGAPDKLDLDVNVTLDSGTRRSVVGFGHGKLNITFLKYERIPFSKSGSCQTSVIAVLEDVSKHLFPITVSIEFKISSRPYLGAVTVYNIIKNQVPQTDVSTFPSSSDKDGNKFSRVLPLMSWKTKPKNKLVMPVYSICNEDGAAACVADLSINSSFKPDSYVIGKKTPIIYSVMIKNLRELAKLPITVEITWLNGMEIRRMDSLCIRSDEINSGVDKRCVKCQLTSHLKSHENVTLVFQLDGSHLGANSMDHQFKFKVIATTASRLLNSAQYVLHESRLDVEMDLSLELSTSRTDTIVYTNKSLEFVGFKQIYEISLDGYTTLSKVKFISEIPTEIFLGNGDVAKVLSAEISYTHESDISCAMSTSRSRFGKLRLDGQGTMNGLGNPYSGSDEKWSDQSDDDESIVAGVKNIFENIYYYINPPTEKPRTLNISTMVKDALYSEAVCDIDSLTPSSSPVITIHLFLNISEFEKVIYRKGHYGKPLLINITTHSRLDPITHRNWFVPGVFKLSSTIISFPKVPSIPLWILLVSVVLGLLVFSIIVHVLRKRGFFERTMRNKLNELKKEVGKDDIDETSASGEH